MLKFKNVLLMIKYMNINEQNEHKKLKWGELLNISLNLVDEFKINEDDLVPLDIFVDIYTTFISKETALLKTQYTDIEDIYKASSVFYKDFKEKLMLPIAKKFNNNIYIKDEVYLMDKNTFYVLFRRYNKDNPPTLSFEVEPLGKQKYTDFIELNRNAQMLHISNYGNTFNINAKKNIWNHLRKNILTKQKTGEHLYQKTLNKYLSEYIYSKYNPDELIGSELRNIKNIIRNYYELTGAYMPYEEIGISFEDNKGLLVNNRAEVLNNREGQNELLKLRRSAHFYFDKLWQDKFMTRRQAYTYLSEQLGLKRSETHIANFDEALCARTILIVMDFLNKKD